MLHGVVFLREKFAMEEGDNADEGGGGSVLRMTASGKDFRDVLFCCYHYSWGWGRDSGVEWWTNDEAKELSRK